MQHLSLGAAFFFWAIGELRGIKFETAVLIMGNECAV
jgi:hypothetical protein